MATLRQTLKTTLEGDATLTAILPGGILDSDDMPQDGGGASSAPRTSDGVQINPFAVIRLGASNAFGSRKVGAERESAEIYFYQDTGYDLIERAIGRVKTLLHDEYLEGDDRQIAHFLYTFSSQEVPADELGEVPCRFSRYQINTIRG